ncbi:MAG TPA: hypothetical protein DCM28_21845 [Phycisphaerales bacterium]|nr:hypothetical protein [Phycisphaerales bacterium]HCD34563.1 hypothetical protein [Phycisphaerales bacterium]|tara:strand:- start:698 stop:1321 length:624 start_codon:yes stop_codon:yes gene_type:complete
MEVFVGQPLFKPGDLVKHPLRPEWGDGEVRQVALTKYNGKEGQRLVIVFKNHGKVTINTAVVQLNAKDKANNDMKSAQSADWLSDIEAQQGNRQNNLTGLPESITDPFTDIITRVERTLGDYKYTDQNPRSLLDWAMRQTGMDDPLSQYTRHDLEEAFKRYVYLRYKHLLELVRTVKRSNKRPLLEALLTKTLPNGAANDLRKAISA